MALSDNFVTSQLGGKDAATWAIVNEFNESYYSGLDVSVYFGGIYIDEISQLQFQEMEQVRPIYSYAAFTPTVICHGTRMTQGSFVLNFKDSNYFNVLLSKINTKSGVSVLEQIVTHFTNIPRSKAEATLIEQVDAKIAAIGTSEYASITKDLTLASIINMAKKDGIATGTSPYTDLMKNLSSRYWVDSPVARATEASNLDMAKYAPKGLEQGFDITIKYGQPDELEGAYGSVKVLRDCHISGFQQIIDDSGRNIAESYTFLCASIY